MKPGPDDLGFRAAGTEGLALFDAVSARTTPNATRKEAQEQAKRSSEATRRKLFEVIRAHGPITADDAGAKLDLTPLQCRPRVCELARSGDIEDAGRGVSASGNSATLWKATHG